MNGNPNPQAVRRYRMNHPQLPQLVSRAIDYRAVAIGVNQVTEDAHIVSAQVQHEMRKSLLVSNRATPEEVLAAKKRLTAILVESVGTVPVGPEWADELMRVMNANHRVMNENHQALTREVRGLNENHEALTREVRELNENHEALAQEVRALAQNVDVRFNDMMILATQNTNRTHGAREVIAQVRNRRGEMPPAIFPENEAMITSMEEDPVDALIIFYGIRPEVGATLNRKKFLLCSHLGLQRLADAFE